MGLSFELQSIPEIKDSDNASDRTIGLAPSGTIKNLRKSQ